MNSNINVTKEDVQKMDLLTDNELKKLNFTELCTYLNTLEIAENILEGSEN